jgi:molybdate transport system substrate-binding protein
LRPARGIRVAWLLLGLLHLGVAASVASAEQVRVAVAANFIEPARQIGRLFHRQTGHRVSFSSGSTGKLYTQITQGAPLDVFLAADRQHARLAVSNGFAVAGSRVTYATGRIALYSPDRDLVSGPQTLTDADFTRLAIANPLTAPYGAAAVQLMRELGVYAALAPHLVQGSNIAQTYQFVATGNAELGFVALSQIIRHREGSRWIVPEDLYTPIAQDAVLLEHARDKPAAAAFLAFLNSPQAVAIKAEYGYATGN